MTRSCPEWIGKDDDEKPPLRVRLRVFDRFGGVCQLTGRKIRPGDDWQADHRLAIINGGQNRENNLWPVLTIAHREKSGDDLKIKSKIARQKAAHLGQKSKPRRSLSPPPGMKYDWSRGRYVRAE